MNFSLVHHRKLSDVLPVPNGLPDLLSNMTKQILKYQPANEVRFLANYLETLLKIQESVIIAQDTLRDIILNTLNVQELMKRTGLSQRQANQVQKVIEEEFSNHLSLFETTKPIKEFGIIKKLICECDIDLDRARKITDMIEVAWNFFLKKHHASKRSCLNPLKSTNVLTDNKPQEKILERNMNEEAAIKIQALIRTQQEKAKYEKMQDSAKLIQKNFRYYLKQNKKEKKSS